MKALLMKDCYVLWKHTFICYQEINPFLKLIYHLATQGHIYLPFYMNI